MIRKLLILIPIFILALACNKELSRAQAPAFLHIDAIKVNTNFSSEGTASDKITTAWVFIDGQVQGTYELPCDFPIIETGNRKIDIYAGMNLNGIASLRTVYPFYLQYSENINLVAQQTSYLNASADSIPVINYKNTSTIEILEDFEGIGLSFEETPKSDTIMFKTADSLEVFRHLNEPVVGTGKVVFRPSQRFETKTISKFVLPKFGADVYVELNYKSDIPFTVGIFANESSQIAQAPVVTVLPSEEWNKIYINLVTEVSGYPNAIDFNVFIGAFNSSTTTRNLFLDNIKLVY